MGEMAWRPLKHDERPPLPLRISEGGKSILLINPSIFFNVRINRFLQIEVNPPGLGYRLLNNHGFFLCFR